MGQAALHLEQKGVRTDVGDLNRTIVKTNRLMQALRNTVAKLRAWIADLQNRRDEIQRQMEQYQASSLPALLVQYLNFRRDERSDWSVHWQVQGTVNDAQRIRHSMDYLRDNEIETVDELDDLLSQVEDALFTLRNSENDNARRIAQINNLKDNYAVYRKLRPVHESYMKKLFKSAKQRFYGEHRYELEQYFKAVRYILKNGGGKDDGRIVIPTASLNEELKALREDSAGIRSEAESLREDLNEMRQVRYYIDKVLAWQREAGTADEEKRGRANAPTPTKQREPKSVMQQLEEIRREREASAPSVAQPKKRRNRDNVL